MLGRNYVSIRKIHELLEKKDDNFKRGKMSDSYFVLSAILNAIDIEAKEFKISKNPSTIFNSFLISRCIYLY